GGGNRGHSFLSNGRGGHPNQILLVTGGIEILGSDSLIL
ncbi:MAG: hypothetical protein QOI53_1680, partial [Verrucomicrobiota bacterium]|nr:hypothetical protein [Verrucomicrobiota bacterium]